MATQRYSVTPHPIDTLLTWVKSGEIAIPEIQRPFVWPAVKVRNLIGGQQRVTALMAALLGHQENSDRENARIEHDNALLRVMMAVMKDDTQLFKRFMDDPDFKRWVSDTSFRLAYRPAATPGRPTVSR